MVTESLVSDISGLGTLVKLLILSVSVSVSGLWSLSDKFDQMDKCLIKLTNND